MDDRDPVESDSRLLVVDASTGDPEALAALLERHLPRLRAYVRLRAGPLVRAKESASDIVQSVCREVLQGLASFRYRGEAAFRQWLFTAALYKLTERQRYYLADKRDAAREARRGDSASGPDRQLENGYRTLITPSRIAIAREQIARLESAFDELPADYQEVLLLSRIIGLSHAEIAEQMERSVSSVKNLLHRAVARLGLLMSGDEDGPPRGPS